MLKTCSNSCTNTVPLQPPLKGLLPKESEEEAAAAEEEVGVMVGEEEAEVAPITTIIIIIDDDLMGAIIIVGKTTAIIAEPPVPRPPDEVRILQIIYVGVLITVVCDVAHVIGIDIGITIIPTGNLR